MHLIRLQPKVLLLQLRDEVVVEVEEEEEEEEEVAVEVMVVCLWVQVVKSH